MTTKDDGARSACPTGPGAYLGGDHPEPVNNPDAALIALELEHDELEASIKGLSEEETDKRADRVGEIAREIWERPASNLHGAAAKLRVLRYHAGQMKHTGDVRCLDTCLDALDHVGDVNLIFMEQEHNRRYFETKFPEGSKESDENTDRIAVLAREIASRPAHTATGATVKLRVIRAYLRHSECDWYEESLDTALAALAAAPAPAVIPAAATGNPDAKLFALEAEIKAAHEGLAAAPDNNAAHEPWYERSWAAQQAMLATPAQTAEGIVSKLRMVANSMGPADMADADTDSIGDQMLKSTVRNAARIGATVPVDPDAAFASLWREHQQCLKDWGPDETPKDEKARDRAFELERQIVGTPAQSVFGVAVKLWIATHDNLPYEKPEYTDEKALVSARDDAVRLSGLGGAS